MSLTIERLGDEAIVLITVYGPVGGCDALYLREELNHLVEEIDGPVYQVADLSRLNAPFGEVVIGLAAADRLYQTAHPSSEQLISVVVVGPREIARIEQEPARQEQYDALDLLPFATLDEALAYARRELNPSVLKRISA